MLRALHAEDGGGYLAVVPDLPGCMSDGDTPAEAVQNVTAPDAQAGGVLNKRCAAHCSSSDIDSNFIAVIRGSGATQKPC